MNDSTTPSLPPSPSSSKFLTPFLMPKKTEMESPSKNSDLSTKNVNSSGLGRKFLITSHKRVGGELRRDAVRFWKAAADTCGYGAHSLILLTMWLLFWFIRLADFIKEAVLTE